MNSSGMREIEMRSKAVASWGSLWAYGLSEMTPHKNGKREKMQSDATNP